MPPRINITTGATASEAERAPSVIVYSPAGYVGVHFPPLGRPRFASTLPTDDEAAAAIRGFVSYYGAYTLSPGIVFHHRLIILGTGPADTLKRFYDIDHELPTHYDLVLNTDALSVEDAAELIVHSAARS